jgi:hypothetical protein
VERDPIEDGGLNLYAYAGGNPTTETDPSGLIFGFDTGENAADHAVDYWANLEAQSTNGWARFGYATMGTFAEMWTPCHSDQTFVGLATLAGGAGFTRIAGPFRNWLRLGPSYSKALQTDVDLSLRWGASPARGGKYIDEIPTEFMRDFNQWLRQQQLPFGGDRAIDPGHFHIFF